MASSSLSALNERMRLAASKGNCEEIEQLIRLGASFDSDKYGRTALHYAAHCGQVKAIRLCITKGCELDAEDNYGCTALHKAVAPDGHVEAVRALLEESCAVERTDENGNTALHEAAWNGHSQTLDALIKIGNANIHAGNKNGQKPMHLACQNGHNQSTRLLLRAGTHPNIKNNSAETALHIASLFGHITCARILLSAGCDINAKNKDGNTALHIAAGLGKQKITRLLIESECDVRVRNQNNQTALELARQNDHADVVLMILGAHKIRKGKRSFFSRKKKKDDKSDDHGDDFHHHHHHHGHSSHHKHEDKHRHKDDQRHGHDDPDAVQGELRVRGRREITGMERQSSGNSKGKSKKKRDKKREDHQFRVDQTRARGLFVKEELKKKVASEKRLHEQIHTGRIMGNPVMRMQRFKDKMGKIIEVPVPVQCNCAPYIKKLENQVEASKERLLHEIDISKARFESRMNNLDKRMTHQAQCLDQLCKERIAAERTECIHRIDRRANEERERSAEEQDARTDILRGELKRWFESRIQPLHEQLSRTCLDDTCIDTSTNARRGRPRAGFYKVHASGSGLARKRSKSEGNLSDREFEEQEEDEEVESEEDEEHDGCLLVDENQNNSRQPSEQSPHRYRNRQPSEAEYAKTGAVPKKNRSTSFRHAVSDEERNSGSSTNGGIPLSLVAGIYRPPLIASHERSPRVESRHSRSHDFVMPSQDTDDDESSESESDSDTASQLSLETVSYKPKSIGGSTNRSSSTHDSGMHTLKGSSVSSDRTSHGPTRGNMIAYQALTVNARPPPPLHTQTNYPPPFSPPISPSSTASQPLSTSTVASVGAHKEYTTSPDQTSSGKPSPEGPNQPPSSSSSGVSSVDASVPNSTPIKYNVINTQNGQTYPKIYKPHPTGGYTASVPREPYSRNRAVAVRDVPPPTSTLYSSRMNGAGMNVSSVNSMSTNPARVNSGSVNSSALTPARVNSGGVNGSAINPARIDSASVNRPVTNPARVNGASANSSVTNPSRVNGTSVNSSVLHPPRTNATGISNFTMNSTDVTGARSFNRNVPPPQQRRYTRELFL